MIAFSPDHVHFLATATLEKPSLSVEQIADWLRRLVTGVGMKILDGPHVCECFDEGNEGITGVVVLSTSHCSIHIWNEAVPRPYLKMDLYSCQRFSIQVITDMLKELNIRVCDYEVIDRNHTNEDELCEGSMFRIHRGFIDFRQ